jgi:hypothetical protein
VDVIEVSKREHELRGLLSQKIQSANIDISDDASERREQTDVHTGDQGTGRGEETDTDNEGGTRSETGSERASEEDADVANSKEGSGIDELVPSTDGVRTDEADTELGVEHGSTESTSDGTKESSGDSDDEVRSTSETLVIGHGSSGEVREGARHLIGGVWI